MNQWVGPQGYPSHRCRMKFGAISSSRAFGSRLGLGGEFLGEPRPASPRGTGKAPSEQRALLDLGGQGADGMCVPCTGQGFSRLRSCACGVGNAALALPGEWWPGSNSVNTQTRKSRSLRTGSHGQSRGLSGGLSTEHAEPGPHQHQLLAEVGLGPQPALKSARPS